MNTSDLKNIVFLKEVNSNIVDEAIIILKPNIKIKEAVVEGKNKFKNNNSSNYILNEAQMIVSNYISNFKKEDEKLLKKYKKKMKIMKIINICLSILIIGYAIIKII